MKMKLRLALLFAAVLLLSAVAFADGPVNPLYDYARDIEKNFKPGEVIAEEERLEMECVTQPTATTAGKWRVTNGSEGMEYSFVLLSYKDGEFVVNHIANKVQAPEYSYEFLVSGYYTIVVEGSDGRQGQSEYFDVTGLPTIDDVASDLVDKCIAAGCSTDFEKALWLHDWLINNVYYDTTYSYYSADSTLLRGTGVCDGYSRAYEKLLQIAGIPTNRAIGADHSWNYVQMDGEWYHVDATWDDPAIGNSKVSGMENHMYMGLSDIILLDHRVDPYSCTPRVCSCFENNYFIRTGKVSMWTDLFVDDIRANLAKGIYTFQLEAPVPYPIEMENYKGSGQDYLVYTITAYALYHMDWGGVKLSVMYDGLNICFEPESGVAPTTAPSENPTTAPSEKPTTAPSQQPTAAPTVAPGFVPVLDVELNLEKITIGVKQSVQTVEAEIFPAYATDKSITWAIADGKIASVDANGKITGLKKGKTLLTVTAVNGGDGVSETCEIEVVGKGKGVTKVKLNKKSAELPRGKALTLSATIKPAGAKDKKIVWVSSDPTIATVNSKGKVKAVGMGDVVITAYGSSGKKAECRITVTGPMVKKITLSAPKTMKVGETVQIVATITPTDAANQNLKWKVSDKKIATISKTGELTALKKGKVTITATARDGSKVKATVVIKIKK